MELIKYDENIRLVKNFLPKPECDKLIELSETVGYEEAKVQVGRGRQSMIKGIRNNERIMFKDVELAERLWEKSAQFIPEIAGNYRVIGLNEMLRFYKYSIGHRFKMHRDGSYERNAQECSFYTYMIYLNDDFEGGETEFEDNVTIVPQQGDLLIFYHPVRHEGKVLLDGTKYVLRTDIMYQLEQ